MSARNIWRVAAFDVLAPLGACAGLVAIGLVLAWPLWWVAVCAVLLFAIAELMVLDFWLARRDSVTVGTDDERPVLRLAAVALSTAALVAAVVVGYVRWTMPDDTLRADADTVTATATQFAELAATVSPSDPTGSIDRAAQLMVPERVEEFKQKVGKSAAERVNANIAVQAKALTTGIEGLGPSAAAVAVVLRSTQTSASQEIRQVVVPVRVSLTKRDGAWLVQELSPIHAR